MPKYSFTSPEGDQYEISGPEGSTREQAFSILQEGIKNGHYKPLGKAQPDNSYLGKVKSTLKDLGNVSALGALPGAAEAITAGVGDMANAAVSGIYGMGKSLFTGRPAATEIQNTQEAISKAIPYAPETESGKKIYSALGLLPEGIHALGETAFEKTKSPLVGAAVETLGNATMLGLPFGKKGKRAVEAPAVAPPTALSDAIKAAKAKQEGVPQGQPKGVWESTVNNLGGTIPPKETPFSGMVDTLSGKPRVIEPEFKMAPEEAPYKKTGAEAAADDATVARLQAAVDRQNPQLPEMIATKEGIVDPSTNTPGLRAAIGLDELPNRTQAIFEDQAQQVKQAQQEAAWNQHAQEQLAQDTHQRAVDEAQMAQEGALQPLEEQLRREAYQPPTQEDLRAGHLAGRSPRVGSPIRKLGSSGQGGSAPMIQDIAQGIVNTIKGAYRLVKPEERPDTLTHPTSPENIAKKQEMGRKAKAVGLKDTMWDTPTTVEEAIATTQKDLSPLTQRLGAGAAGTAHRNPKNGVVKYINDIRQKSQQAHERLVTQYLNGPTGAARALRDVPSKEYPAIMRLKNELAKEKVDYTPEIGQAAGLSTKAQAYMEATQRAINASADSMDRVAKMAGMEPLNRQKGYFGSNWDRGYPARVGYWKERVVNGKKERYFETKAFVSEETALGRRNAANWYKEKYPGISVERLGRQGINTSTNPIRGFDALGSIMAEIAKHDPEFAKWKEVADTRLAENTAKLYGVDKHFLDKAGVEGYRGNQPWKSAMDNAKNGLLSEIEHLNQVFKYATQQEFVNNAKKIVSDPLMQDKPHTVNWVDSYTKHVTGESLNPVGAGMNSIVDGVFRAMGLGGNIPHKTSQAIRTVAQSMILNISNVRYATVNTLQILNAVPEMAKVMADAGLHPMDITTSMANGSIARSALGVAHMLGKDLEGAPIAPHLIEAYKWGQEHGIHHYTETVNSREVLDSKAMHFAKKAGAWPSTVPEWLTRPTAFLWFVDLFHKTGLRGEELFTKARGATDYALANAVKEEKPSIYASLGIMGNHIGELKNYSHNIADQYATRVLEAKDHKLAMASAVGVGLLTAGVSGTMFYKEADALSQWLTGKTLREHAGSIGQNHMIYDGVISATSGSDWQSSFSMAEGPMDPTKMGENLAGVSVMKMLKMGMAGYEYAMDPSHANFAELAKNTVGGLQGVVEDQMLTSPEGFVLDKKGQHKYESPRTPEERNKRAIMGVRPLRERIEDESLYAKDKKMKKVNEADKKYLDALVAGLNFNDAEAVQRALHSYLDNGGDPDKLTGVIDKNQLDAYISARQRHGGIDPGDSLTTIRRWMNYNQ